MFELLRARLRHGYQAVPDIRKAEVDPMFRGFPLLDTSKIKDSSLIRSVCPTGAFSSEPIAIDLGRCVFCGNCARASDGVEFISFHKTSAGSRSNLIVRPGDSPESYMKKAFAVNKHIRSIFGGSLKLRSVSAGGCNACEYELNASGNVNFDMGRFGIEFVASPRHADGIVISGPVTDNMAEPLRETFDAVPDPKIVIAAGTCAISGGHFEKSHAICREFFDTVKVDLYIPGCPPHPLTIINGILALIGKG